MTEFKAFQNCHFKTPCKNHKFPSLALVTRVEDAELVHVPLVSVHVIRLVGGVLAQITFVPFLDKLR